jgi:hypothetical protein
LIDKLTLKIFPNANSLLKNKESIQIFNDTNNLIGDSVPRFQNYSYNLPQFVALFANEKNITDSDLRTFVFNNIKRDNLLNILGETAFTSIYNPYMTTPTLRLESDTKNLGNIL